MTPQEHANLLLAEYQSDRHDMNGCIYDLLNTLNLMEFLSNSRDGMHTIRTNQHKLEQALRKLHRIVMMNYVQPENAVIEWPIRCK